MSAHIAHVQKKTKYNNNINNNEGMEKTPINKFNKRVRAARNTNVCHIFYAEVGEKW